MILWSFRERKHDRCHKHPSSPRRRFRLLRRRFDKFKKSTTLTRSCGSGMYDSFPPPPGGPEGDAMVNKTKER